MQQASALTKTAANPAVLIQSLWRNGSLIYQMARREVLGRYAGTVAGLGWAVFQPILMLSVYTFVFSIVFKARWAGPDTTTSHVEFALLLFIGLIVHGLFSELLLRSPALVTSNVNYVKKVIFPLEILPVITLVAALFHAAIGIAVLLVARLLIVGSIPWTVIWLPIVLAPLAVMALGVSWTLAAMGVFIRDLGQMMAVVANMMLFLSPIFFPVTALPEAFRPLVHANPLTFIIEEAREVVMWGRMPDLGGLALYTTVACAVACLGFFLFQKTRKGFADVL